MRLYDSYRSLTIHLQFRDRRLFFSSSLECPHDADDIISQIMIAKVNSYSKEKFTKRMN